MLERFDPDARQRVISIAAEEAKRRGDGRIGTEHLVLALLHDGGALAARTLGVNLATARAALVELDRVALAAVGIDITLAPASVPVLSRRRPPFTSGARGMLKRAVLEAQAVKARRVQARHLLLGALACERPDPAAELFAAVGVDPADVRVRLTRST